MLQLICLYIHNIKINPIQPYKLKYYNLFQYIEIKVKKAYNKVGKWLKYE